MTRLIRIVDTETTALSPEVGQIWDLAILEYGEDGRRAEHQWFMKPDLTRADPGALAVGRYYERTASLVPVRAHDPAAPNGPWWSSRAHVAARVAPMLSDVILLSAVPSFDAGHLRAFLAAHGHAGAWHYRLRDIGSMAYGWLCMRWASGDLEPGRYFPPLDAGTDDFAVALGVDPGRFERHSALGDCRLVAAMLDVITGVTP